MLWIVCVVTLAMIILFIPLPSVNFYDHAMSFAESLGKVFSTGVRSVFQPLHSTQKHKTRWAKAADKSAIARW